MTDTTRPPVPRKLREMLKDYPQHIERLQEALDYVTQTSSAGVDPFERATWALESRLGKFVIEAREEVEAAEASGDAAAIERAKEKESLMSRASWKHVWRSDDALWNFFGQR